ncbi:MAG: hypothetical protein ABIT38_02700 [Gemmatimonadaceae bacterium]
MTTDGSYTEKYETNVPPSTIKGMDAGQQSPASASATSRGAIAY